MQCNTKNTSNYYTCSGGLDTTLTFGLCVAKPVAATGTPQELCNTCLSNLRPLVNRAVNSTLALSSSSLATEFYDLCASKGYSLTACARVQSAISASYSGNLVRRAGALCIRLGECSTTTGYLVTASNGATATTTATTQAVVTAVVTNSTDNSTQASPSPAPATTTAAAATLTGPLDACTIEGVVGGAAVTGTYTAAGEHCSGEGGLLVMMQV